MSLSYELTNNDDIEVARVVSVEESRVIYLNSSKADSLLDIPFDEDTCNLVIGKSVHDLMYELSCLPGDKSEIYIKSDELMSIIPADCSERVLISGESKQGKSTLAARYAMEYKNKYPDNLIHLFCRESDDIAYDGVELEEIIVDDDIMNSNLQYKNLHHSLVIFDDLDNLPDKRLSDWIHALVNEVSACGRKQNIHIIYISHIITNYKQTRTILSEANKVIFFNGCDVYHISRFLKDYAGLTKDSVNYLLSLEGWVCLSRQFPRYVIHKQGIFMLR